MSDIENFQQFGLDPKILDAIAKTGYTKPTPIQAKAIPVVLEGRDVMGAAQTGTGKTASFGLPLLQKILPKANTSTSPARHPVRALVLTPTRELACQVAENLVQYSANTGLRVGAVYGGVDIKPQAALLKNGIEVLIATPGRLLDHIDQRNTNLSQVSIVILDEADRMLDMGFLPDITRILQKLPENRQSLMFSATFSPEIKSLAKSFLKDPVLVEVARQNATAATITQEVYRVHESQKTDALIDLLNTKGVDEEGDSLQAIIFVNAKITSRRLARQLEKFGFNADAIHGDKTQQERTQTLQNFKEGKLQYLVATDVAARGLDIPDMPMVINYDVPFVAEDYVHRIGRTGRAGSKGLAMMLMTASDEKNFEAIQRLVKKHFQIAEMDPPKARMPSHRSRTYSYVEKKDENADPLFDMPYVPKPASAGASSETKLMNDVMFRSHKRTGRPVAALLGGSGKRLPLE